MRNFFVRFSGVFILIVVTLILVELVFRFWVFRSGSNYDRIYYTLTLPGNKPGYVSQPYLNYINNPGLKNLKGKFSVNSMGIRYPREISLRKPDSTLRILFLGGSTTFGDIDDEYDVFPALIETALRDSIHSLDPRYTRVECLNGGVHGLTSAEILTHFQFKYQYLQPDLIVLHTGFNDAFTYAQIHDAKYQPDYHNTRRVFYDIPDLTDFDRFLMHSKAISYYLIQTRLKGFLKTTLEDNIFFYHTNDKIWFEPGNSAIQDTNYNAFYNNIKTLAGVAAGRGIPMLLVPEVCDSLNMPPKLNVSLPAGLRLHKGLLKLIAERDNLYYCQLPEEEFTDDLFLHDDGIHVNEKGEKLKAYYIGGYIKGILRQRAAMIQNK